MVFSNEFLWLLRRFVIAWVSEHVTPQQEAQVSHQIPQEAPNFFKLVVQQFRLNNTFITLLQIVNLYTIVNEKFFFKKLTFRTEVLRRPPTKDYSPKRQFFLKKFSFTTVSNLTICKTVSIETPTQHSISVIHLLHFAAYIFFQSFNFDI